MTSARLAGHGLTREGWPFLASGVMARSRTDEGMARCECGALSEKLASVAARKRWHREHKDRERQRNR